MSKSIINMQVFFEDPFWVGVFERFSDNKISVCKVTFGAEPKDYEVYEFILNNFYNLKFSNPIEKYIKEKKTNPKTARRKIRKQLENLGVGTKSMQALQLQHAEGKVSRKLIRKQENEKIQERKYKLRKQKKLEKHKGR